jgi:hypothetical protein
MNRSLLLALVLGFAAVATAAQQDEPRKFPVMSADPWLIKTLLEGGMATAPELSTLWLLQGMPRNTKPGGAGLLEGGHLMVNPTDNALWWIPDHKGNG